MLDFTRGKFIIPASVEKRPGTESADTGLYVVTAGSGLYCADSLYKASCVSKYTRLRQLPGKAEEARVYADRTGAAPSDLIRNPRHISRAFRARGLAVAAGGPLLWLWSHTSTP